MSTPSVQPRKYQWFAVGDINGFFGLMFDNMTVLALGTTSQNDGGQAFFYYNSTSTAADDNATVIAAIFPEMNNCGNSSAAAAPMIGVASKKEKRTASSWERPFNNPPAIAEPVRENPGMSARICIVPTLIPCHNESFAMRASPRSTKAPTASRPSIW